MAPLSMSLLETMEPVLAEEPLDLVRAALLLGRLEGSTADPAVYGEQLEEMAATFRRRADDLPAGLARVEALNGYLFQELGFHGNVEDYYDPRNSFLEEVMDRKTGLPITLSLLYVEVGRRAGLPLRGVSFPGHFLVRHEAGEDVVLLDPFRGGRVLASGDLEDLLHQAYGRPLALDPSLLRPAAGREILARMLRNLKGVYMASEQLSRIREVLDVLLLLDPDSSLDRRDRGLVHYELGDFLQAGRDLAAYLEREPQASDAPRIRSYLEDIASRLRTDPEGPGRRHPEA